MVSIKKGTSICFYRGNGLAQKAEVESCDGNSFKVTWNETTTYQRSVSLEEIIEVKLEPSAPPESSAPLESSAPPEPSAPPELSEPFRPSPIPAPQTTTASSCCSYLVIFIICAVIVNIGLWYWIIKVLF